MEVDNRLSCQFCKRKFTRNNNLKNHIKTKHDNVGLSFSCYLCRRHFKRQEKYLKHIDNHIEDLYNFLLHQKEFDKIVQIFVNISKIIFRLVIC